MLKVQGLTGGYGDSQVLFGIDFEAQAGQAVSLIGRNGMGKTTTVRTLMGMLPARGGGIELQGKVLGRLASHVVARLGVGLVPEGRRVFGSLSVEENLVATARAAEGRSGWAPGGALGGGDQQRLAGGRALMTNPQLLVLDEATEGLAPLIRHEIWDCLRTL